MKHCTYVNGKEFRKAGGYKGQEGGTVCVEDMVP